MATEPQAPPGAQRPIKPLTHSPGSGPSNPTLTRDTGFHNHGYVFRSAPMNDPRISQLNELRQIPDRLLGILNEAESTASPQPAATGACFYTSLGVPRCVETTQVTCSVT